MKLKIFLLMASFPLFFCEGKVAKIFIPPYEDLGELMRIGYDSIDSSVFPDICKLLNDSILAQDYLFGLLLGCCIDEEFETIDWCLWEMDFPIPSVPDILTFWMSIRKENKLIVKKRKTSIADVYSLINKNVFHPDPLYDYITHREIETPITGKVNKSRVGIYLDAHVKERKGFTVNDWKFFFKCLSEILRACGDEMERVSLDLFNKGYSSLSFEEKEALIDVAGRSVTVLFE